MIASMTASASASRALTKTLEQRLAFGLGLDSTTPRTVHTALSSIARFAARAGAQHLDAVALDKVIHIAFVSTAKTPLALQKTTHTRVENTLGCSLRFTDRVWLSNAPLACTNTRDAIVSAVRWQLARVAALAPTASSETNFETLRQLRVSLRRARICLRLLSPRDRAVTESIAFVRALDSLAGAVRDLDVASITVSTLDASRERDALARAIEAQRIASASALEAFVHTKDFRETLTTLLSPSAVWSDRKRLGAEPELVFGGFLEDALARLLRSLDGDLTGSDGLHDVRGKARSVRDLIGLFGATLTRTQRAWRTRLRPLQAALGAINDREVLLALARSSEPSLGTQIELQRALRVATVAPLLGVLAVKLRSR